MNQQRWLFEDSLPNRVLVTHNKSPRFTAEFFWRTEAPSQGVEFGGPDDFILGNINWVDAPIFDRDELQDSLAVAWHEFDWATSP